MASIHFSVFIGPSHGPQMKTRGWIRCSIRLLIIHLHNKLGPGTSSHFHRIYSQPITLTRYSNSQSTLRQTRKGIALGAAELNENESMPYTGFETSNAVTNPHRRSRSNHDDALQSQDADWRPATYLSSNVGCPFIFKVSWATTSARIHRSPLERDSHGTKGGEKSTVGTFTAGRVALLVGASIGSGLFGYVLAQTQVHEALDTRTAASVPDSPTFGSPLEFQTAISELKATFTDESAVSTDPEDLHVHGFSENDYYPGAPHSVVVFPESTQDVVKIVKIATKYRMPVVPYSGAMSLEGHFRGHTVGGICVNINRMDRILEIHEADSDLVCQPAAWWVNINDMLQKKGIKLFFPIDPAPGATIGGMLSTGCSGTNAVRYGTAKGEWFLNATVVLPSGEIIKTRRRSCKSAAGFDLTKLFVGAEGTLGIITEVTIRLAPVLPTNVAVVQFPDVRSATAASIEVINHGAGIQCVELLDALSMKAINHYGMAKRKWPEKDSLFFKFQGPSNASLKETATTMQQIAEKHGGSGFTLARNEKEAYELWMDRKNLFYSKLSFFKGSRTLTTDVCVPMSKLPELIHKMKKDLDQVGLVSTVIGHVGDGNFHAMLVFTTDEELEIAQKAAHRIAHRAIEMDGTCTGEHVVGIGKKKYLNDELGEGTVELMKTVKRAIDPFGLFNPGKLYPDPPSRKKNAEDVAG